MNSLFYACACCTCKVLFSVIELATLNVVVSCSKFFCCVIQSANNKGKTWSFVTELFVVVADTGRWPHCLGSDTSRSFLQCLKQSQQRHLPAHRRGKLFCCILVFINLIRGKPEHVQRILRQCGASDNNSGSCFLRLCERGLPMMVHSLHKCVFTITCKC